MKTTRSEHKDKGNRSDVKELLLQVPFLSPFLIPFLAAVEIQIQKRSENPLLNSVFFAVMRLTFLLPFITFGTTLI